MTEIGAEMPEVVSTMPTSTETNNTAENLALNASTNCDEEKSIVNKKDDSTLIDGKATEEADAQITIATEKTGDILNDGKIAASDDVALPPIADDIKKTTPNNNASSDAMETSTTETTEQPAQKVEENGAEVSTCDKELSKPSTAEPEAAEVVVGPTVPTGQSTDDQKPSEEEEVHLAKIEVQQKCSETLPTPSTEDDKPKVDVQKENGIAKNTDGIVDLGDDTDDEVATPNTNIQHNDSNVSKNGHETSISTNSVSTVNKSNVSCNDSDGAVVIGSDSECEDIPEKKPNIVIKQPPAEMEDDDDDDCVVIEDNTPAPNSDLNKRKNLSVEESTAEDLQPPVKRMRSSMPNSNEMNVSMDSRISSAEDTNSKKMMENNVYPVTISPATNANQGPPKLVPMSNVANMQQVGVANLGPNSTLLPGLTDDMFVLEAPSFIVPYIYEKPPASNLMEVVRDIESKYSLSKEDLAEADKSDEFDMITEQNKSEKLGEGGDVKKKKKRRGGDDGDESWSEQSEEEEDDDDDDDSETGVKTKVLIKEASDDLTALQGAIKPAAAVAQSTPVAPNGAAKPGAENYFESPLGKFFMDIGVGLVQEFVQSDLIRLQKRKMRKSLGKNTMDFERAITALSGNLDASRKRNSPFKFTMKRCEFCNFKSESALSMANHYETPHMNGPLYKCNFCTFEIRNATEIVYHMEAVHNIKARLIKPLPYHQCPNCGFEDNGKAKLARHQPVCAKKFRPELNLAPSNDWEAPAKIPRIKPRHGLVGTATAYQAMAAQAAAQKAALASIQQQQQVQQQQRTLQAAALAAQNAANKMRGRAPIVPKPGPNNSGMIRQPHQQQQIRSPMASNVVLQNNYQLPGNQLLQNAANAMAKKANAGGQPSISITPLPRQAAASPAAAASTSKVPPAGVKPGQNPGGNKAQFVICEICDGYIKDLEQLRNHMQWMHKVKIHPKMIYNRPPLNCQKCQFRFFTDQGLERHLLGSHGLVTSSMQEAANKGKDSGRCPVCGRMYQWKLLNHVSRDHHMTLKPAHLSYKCTVCTATFGMYKQFETHVYTAHSTVAKRAMDGKKTNAPGPSSSSSSSSSSCQRIPTTNDSILKPLKINDEITIIPQPATKPRITNVESHVID